MRISTRLGLGYLKSLDCAITKQKIFIKTTEFLWMFYFIFAWVYPTRLSFPISPARLGQGRKVSWFGRWRCTFATSAKGAPSTGPPNINLNCHVDHIAWKQYFLSDWTCSDYVPEKMHSITHSHGRSSVTPWNAGKAMRRWGFWNRSWRWNCRTLCGLGTPVVSANDIQNCSHVLVLDITK